MSLLIGGMEMPKPGSYEAVIVVLDKFTAEIAISPAQDDIGYWKEYPLVHVPPHGRCVDADKLMQEMRLLIKENMLSRDDARELLETIDNVPTVIEAEEET